MSDDWVVAEIPYWEEYLGPWFDNGTLSLFEYRAIRQAVAVSWHAGMQPTPEDIKILVDNTIKNRKDIVNG